MDAIVRNQKYNFQCCPLNLHIEKQEKRKIIPKQLFLFNYFLTFKPSHKTRPYFKVNNFDNPKNFNGWVFCQLESRPTAIVVVVGCRCTNLNLNYDRIKRCVLKYSFRSFFGDNHTSKMFYKRSNLHKNDRLPLPFNAKSGFIFLIYQFRTVK